MIDAPNRILSEREEQMRLASEEFDRAHALWERADAAVRAITPRVKTRDVGQCVRCTGLTSSGMDVLCNRCAIATLTLTVEHLKSAVRLADSIERNLVSPVVLKENPQ